MKLIKKCYNIRMIGIHRLLLAQNAIGSPIKNNDKNKNNQEISQKNKLCKNCKIK